MERKNLSSSELLELPDELFGQRWPVFKQVRVTGPFDVFLVFEGGVPDRLVVWEVFVLVTGVASNLAYVEFGWTDRAPASAAEGSGIQKMFPGQGEKDGLDYNLIVPANTVFSMRNLKVMGPHAGLKPAFRIDDSSTINDDLLVGLVISSVPG